MRHLSTHSGDCNPSVQVWWELVGAWLDPSWVLITTGRPVTSGEGGAFEEVTHGYC